MRQQNTARSGQIVVAMIEDEATCKTLKIEDDGHMWLLPENPEYEPIDGEGATIIGIVTALHRDY